MWLEALASENARHNQNTLGERREGKKSVIVHLDKSYSVIHEYLKHIRYIHVCKRNKTFDNLAKIT